MTIKTILTVAISASALLACNGGGNNQNSTPVPTPPPAPAPAPTPYISTYSYLVTPYGAGERIQMNPDGTFGVSWGGDILFDLPTSIVFNDGFAYVVNSAVAGSFIINSVSRCNTDGPMHTLAECKTVANGFNWPYGIAFNKEYAYITNINDSYTSLNGGYVSKCKVDKLNESLEECTTTGIGYSFPRNITFFESYAYIANSNNSFSYPNTAISRCQVNESGNLNQCTNILTSINQLSGITVYYGYLYYTSIVNNSTGEGKITSCQILRDGSLNTCKTAVSNLYAPINIAFNNSHAYIITNKNNLYPSIYICDVNIDQTLSNCSGFSSSDQYQAIAFKEIIGS